MTALTGLAPWAVVLPLIGACAALLAPRRRTATIGVATMAATLIPSVAVAWEVWTHGASRYAVAGWGAPLGIDFLVDGLSAVLLLTSSIAGVCIAIYAVGYFEGPGHSETARSWLPQDGFWPVALLLQSGLNMIFLSGDAFNLYVALEVMTIAAVALIALENKPEALIAGMRYLLAALFGSLAYLMGVALLYAEFHTLDLMLIGEQMAPTPAAMAAVALVTVGLGLKIAIFPLHFWLPRAHAGAPAPASAILSALVITASFYLLLRVWFGAFPAALSPAAAQLAGAMGACAIVWGAVQAVRQKRLKLMIAYSTVSQIGYLFLLIPLATAVAAPVALQGWSGGVFHAVTHAFAKAAMFLAAGAIARGVGHDGLSGIRGLAGTLPVPVYAFGIAGITLIGLPPTGGFIGKWLMLSAALQTGQWWWAAIILTGGVLTAGYVFLVLGQSMSVNERVQPPPVTPVPAISGYAALALAVISMLLGVRAVDVLELLAIGNPFFPAIE